MERIATLLGTSPREVKKALLLATVVLIDAAIPALAACGGELWIIRELELSNAVRLKPVRPPDRTGALRWAATS